MRLLIEEYRYNVADVQDILDGLFTLQDIEGKISVSYVGYYFNPKIHDVVFILPKVLIAENEKVFGRYEPRNLIDFDNDLLQPLEHKFLYEFAVWIHRAIVVYNNSHDRNGIILRKQFRSEGRGAKQTANTLLDVIISLIRFAQENRSFFTFVLRNQRSGLNKINWTRTICTSTAIVQNDCPVYLNPVNKKRQINFDEELLVIFFSILDWVHHHFGFPVEVPFGFSLIKGAEFDRYLSGYGRLRLRQIKYKYFSDVTMRLWELCYAFFDRAYKIKTDVTAREYLLAKSFHVVFEAMIDELIGERDENIPNGLKNQEDGKLVDHFYAYEGLLINREEQNDIYYIGDSKYYKIGHDPHGESVAKQFTYARNVIQWNLGLFLDPKNMAGEQTKYRDIQLRDDVTEGYNVIPNFFISANINPDTLSYEERIERRKGSENICRQFDNRLYDRDTLIVSHYDVNFLFILALYARDHSGAKAQWRRKIRDKFRREIQSMLSQRFDFYAMTAHPDVDGEAWLKANFQQMLGKTYSPFLDKGVFSLALDKSDKYAGQNARLLASLRENFYVVDCPIGTEPAPRIAAERSAYGAVSSPAADKSVFLTTLIMREEIASGRRTQIAEQYTIFCNHAAEGKTYVQLRFPSSGDVGNIKYLIPIFDFKIEGYYDVTSISFGHRTKTFNEHGVEIPVRLPTLRLKLGAYHPLDHPCAPVKPIFANQIWDKKTFLSQIEHLKSDYDSTDMREPDIDYGQEQSDNSGYIE